MATWYVRSGGSDLNSGSTDSDAADQSGAAGVVVTTTLTEVGAFSGAAATGAINLQDAGNSLIRTYTKVNDDSITLDSAPTSGDGTYAWKIGGARATIQKVIGTGVGQNAKWATGDYCGIKGGTYTENNLTNPSVGIAYLYSSDGVEVVVDGTGGAGGSDTLIMQANSRWTNIAGVNAVDQGIRFASTGNQIYKCRVQASGGIGVAALGGNNRLLHTKIQSAGAQGITGTDGGFVVESCGVHDSVGDGFFSNGQGQGGVYNSIFSDSGGDGVEMNRSGPAVYEFCGNTCVGNTSDGLELTTTGSLAPNGIVLNNIFANNGGYGVNSSAGAQTVSYYLTDYNLYFGNTTAARNNFNTGTHDSTSDPAFTDRANDDWSIKFGGGAYKTGFSPFKNPTLNALNIGAVPGPGSAEIYIYTSPQSGGFRRF